MADAKIELPSFEAQNFGETVDENLGELRWYVNLGMVTPRDAGTRPWDGTQIGKRQALAAGATAAAWPGVASEPALPATAGTIQAVSTDANDTALGTGARTIVVHYINASGYERAGVCTLDGTTPADVNEAQYNPDTGNYDLISPTTAATGWSINYAEINQAGTGLSNAGRIDISAGGAIGAAMGAGDGVTYSSWLHIGIGQIALLSGFTISSQIPDDTLGEFVVDVPQFAAFFAPRTVAGLYGGSSPLVFDAPKTIPGPVRILLKFTNDHASSATNIRAILQAIVIGDNRNPDPNPELQPSHF